MWAVYILIGIVLGGGAGWYYFGKVKSVVTVEADDVIVAKLEEGLGIVDSLWAAAFGPVGVHPGVVVDLCNKLWVWAGKPEKGKP